MLDTYKNVAIFAVIMSLGSALLYIRHTIIINERNRVNEEWKAKEAAVDLQVKNTLIAKNKEISEKQLNLEAAHKVIIDKNREIENAQKTYNALRAKYANGALRLSVSTIHKDSGAEQAGNPASTAGTQYEDRELLPDVSTTILDFARDYQRNLRLKNECIDLYNNAREVINHG